MSETAPSLSFASKEHVKETKDAAISTTADLGGSASPEPLMCLVCSVQFDNNIEFADHAHAIHQTTVDGMRVLNLYAKSVKNEAEKTSPVPSTQSPLTVERKLARKHQFVSECHTDGDTDASQRYCRRCDQSFRNKTDLEQHNNAKHSLNIIVEKIPDDSAAQGDGAQRNVFKIVFDPSSSVGGGGATGADSDEMDASGDEDADMDTEGDYEEGEVDDDEENYDDDDDGDDEGNDGLRDEKKGFDDEDDGRNADDGADDDGTYNDGEDNDAADGDGSMDDGDAVDAELSWTCDVCSSLFPSRKHLREHMKRMHSDAAGAYSDEEETSRDDEPVPRGVSRSAMWYCTHCNVYSDTRQRLQRHITMNHVLPMETAAKGGPEDVKPDVTALNTSSIANTTEAATDAATQQMSDIPSYIEMVDYPETRCQICEKTLSSFYGLRYHVLRKHLGMMLNLKTTSRSSSGGDGTRDVVARCHPCDLSFTSSTKLQRHYQAQHFDIFAHNEAQPDGAPVVCYVCGDEIKNHDALRRHLIGRHRRDSKSTSVHCVVCKNSFVNDARLQVHVRQRHQVGGENGVFQCNHCHVTFGELDGLAAHYKACNDSMNTCPTCNKVFSTRNNMLMHQAKHTDERPFFCAYCSARFKNKATLENHEVVVHETRVRIRCKHCSKAVANPAALKLHIARHHTKQRDYTCEHCGLSFMTKAGLKTHVVGKHKQASEHQCRHCHKYFAIKSTLIKHVNDVHLSDATFPCEVCGKLFKTQAAVRQHMNGHTAEKTYYCSECDAQFLWHSSLQHHLELYHNDGSHRFKCKVCEEEFSSRKALYQHKRHTCVRRPRVSYPCQLCNVVCTLQQSLKRHMRRKHPSVHSEMFPPAEQKERLNEDLKGIQEHIKQNLGAVRKRGTAGNVRGTRTPGRPAVYTIRRSTGEVAKMKHHVANLNNYTSTLDNGHSTLAGEDDGIAEAIKDGQSQSGSEPRDDGSEVAVTTEPTHDDYEVLDDADNVVHVNIENSQELAETVIYQS